MMPLVLLVFAAAPPLAPEGLTVAERREGWLSLVDGETTLGWKIDGEARVQDGVLLLGGEKPTRAETTTRLWTTGVRVVAAWEGKQPPSIEGHPGLLASAPGKGFSARQVMAFPLWGDPWPTLTIRVPAGTRLALKEVKVRPSIGRSLFDGKTLDGWKAFNGDPKREKSTFAAKDGILTMKSGPGDLATEKLFDDFVLQIDCKTNGKHLNSGVFFRAIPGQYQNGYECQIHNDFTLSPAKKYLVDMYDPKTNRKAKAGTRELLSAAKDFGTGAIYRRVPARKAVAKDGEWFTLTVAAQGRHIATWVDGVQQVDWTDDRPANDNPRLGYREKAGAISLQGHDPTTDLSFRNIRIAAIPRKP